MPHPCLLLAADPGLGVVGVLGRLLEEMQAVLGRLVPLLCSLSFAKDTVLFRLAKLAVFGLFLNW